MYNGYAGSIYDCGCAGETCDCRHGLGFVPPGATSTGTTGTIATAAALDPEPYSKMALTVTSAFMAAWNKIQSWLGIGDGRREADAIVPVQNELTARLAAIVAAYPTAGLTTLQSFFTELNAMKQEFIRFVNDPRFTDGRASAQALYGDGSPTDPGMLFYFDDNMGKIAQRITALGGTVPQQTSGYVPPYTSTPQNVGAMGNGLAASVPLLMMVGLAFSFLGKKR